MRARAWRPGSTGGARCGKTSWNLWRGTGWSASGDVAERLRNGPLPRRGGGKNWLKPILPQICADERRSNRSLLPQMNADEHRSKAEPMRAEVLYPQLRGMRCVTRTVLWAMSAFGNPLTPKSLKHGGTEEAEQDLTADHADDHPSTRKSRVPGTPADERGLKQREHEVFSTDRSIYTRADESRRLLGVPAHGARAWL